VHDGEWFDIGTPDGLNQAEAFMNQKFPGRRRR
jgi:NDP-sugar pyrophosphorylase family protein